MTDIVIRALSNKEAHELRLIKLHLEERTWRTLVLRIVREWKDRNKEKVQGEDGIMCTECKYVYWDAISVEKCRCGDTDIDHRINVNTADFEKGGTKNED